MQALRLILVRISLVVLLPLALVACEEMQPPPQQPVAYVAPTQDPSAPTPQPAPQAAATAPPSAPAATTVMHPTQSFERAVHEQVTPRAKACYEHRTQEDPRVGEGVVGVRVVFRSGDGAMTVSQMGSTLNDPPTYQCIAAAFQNLTWKPNDGKEYDFNVPFDFVKSTDSD